MMSKWIILLAWAFALGGCQGQALKSEKVVEETVVNQTSDADAVKARVQEIYAAVFKVYNEEDSLRNLDIQMENGVWEHRDKFNADYCSKEWNALLAQIDEIDSLYHGDELGFWDFDYWIMGQDWHELSISDVEVMSVTPSQAAVQIQLHNFDTVQPMILILVNENGVWKIDDFQQVEYDINLKKAMQEYVARETANNKK